jgi:hypothetical protein
MQDRAGTWIGVLLLSGCFAAASAAAADCNQNGVSDAEDIARGASVDCDGNGLPDECDVAPLDLELRPLIYHQFPQSRREYRTAALGDFDGDGRLDLADAVRILVFLFLAGAPPAEPLPGCGADSRRTG